MKKRALSLLCVLALLLALTPFAATADEFDLDGDLGEWDPPVGDYGYADGYFYYQTEWGDAWILGYEGAESNLTIPAALDGLRVTAIGSGAFSGNESITSITVPEGILAIKSFAFSECPNLQTVSLPRTVEEMGEGAFADCASLTTIRVDEDCPALSLHDGVLFDKTGQLLLCYPARRPGTSYTVPEGVSVIGHGAFADARDLAAVTLPESLFQIGVLAFYGCTALTALSLPAHLQLVFPTAFMGCTALTAFTVAADNPSLSVRDGVLFDQPGEILLCYPAGRAGASYAVPQGTLAIMAAAFSDCAALTAIALPNTLSAILDAAFYNCTGLRSLAIPESVDDIALTAFQGCTALERFDVADGNPNYHATDGVLFSNEGNMLLCYPAARPDTSYIVPEGTFTIASGAFSNCSALRSVTLSKDTIEICAYTFSNCPSLTRVDIPARVTYIDDTAFSDCPALTIYGKRGSVAQAYAADHDIPFVATGNAPGNVNGDDAIDTADAVLTLQYAAELIDGDTLDLLAADVNGDNVVDTADAVLILQYAAELIEGFPVEG